jgi:hypothetical protein
MARSYEAARRGRCVAGVIVPLVWIGAVWVLGDVVGKGWLGLEGVWAWVLGVECAVVGIPVAGFLIYLGVVVLWPVVTGKRVDWR